MRVFIWPYVAYLEFSWILWARLLVHFTLYIPYIFLYLLVRVFVLYLLLGCMIPNTLMWSLYISWFRGRNIHLLFFLVSLSWISFLIGMIFMIRSLNILNILPCVGLVMKYPIMSFVGHHYTFNSFLMILAVMKNKWMLVCFFLLLLDDFPLFSMRMALLLSW